MKRALGAVPMIVLVAYMTFANVSHFRLNLMRPLCLVALILLAGSVYALRRRKEATAIHAGFLLCAILNFFMLFALPDAIARIGAAHTATLLYLSLLAAVLIPALLQRRYFTEHFAKKTTPSAVWETGIFKAINRNMTYGWAALFGASAIITLTPDLLLSQRGPSIDFIFQMAVPSLLLLGVGVSFNRKYPPYYQRKMGCAPQTVASREAMTPSVDGVAASPPHKKEEVMSDTLKVVAINGSPHMGIGNTHLLLRMIQSALAEEDVVFEEIFLADKKIDYCIGCAVCLEKGRCIRQDDHQEVIEKLLAADGIILASPVYFRHVTAQMKTFIDRSLRYSHKPRTTWKPGLAVAVSGGMGEQSTAQYLAGLLRVYGAFSVGTLTALAVNPGAFLGEELIEARAKDLVRDLVRAIKEKRRYPAAEDDLFFYLFMKDLVSREGGFMRDDLKHWQEAGLLEGFESYVQQRFEKALFDPEGRKSWIGSVIKEEKAKAREAGSGDSAVRAASDPSSAGSCRELLSMMPQGFKKDAAGAMSAVYQFEIGGPEDFNAYLSISDGQCTYHEGVYGKPDVTIKSPAEVWLAISRGEMDGQTAFMTGKYRVEGDISLLLKLKSLFGA